MTIRGITLFASAILISAMLFFAFWITRPAQKLDPGIQSIEKSIDLILSSYVDKDSFTSDNLLASAIQGLLDYIDDPYSSYAPPEMFEVSFNYSGQFQGIGAEVALKGGQIIIESPLDGSPAQRAGLLPGDIVIAVDGTSVEGKSLIETVLLIRGPDGSEVVLSVLRPGSSLPITISIIRGTITQESVNFYVLEEEKTIGYVRISTFQANTPEQLKSAISVLKEQNVQSLILDLRDNSGGLVDSAIAVLDEFLDSVVVVSLVDASGNKQEFLTNDGGSALDLPLVVMINSFSASASELTAGALQDHNRATLVGAKTFGKGTFNTLFKLPNEGGFYLSTGRWQTPSGRMIEGNGLQPDVLVGPSVNVNDLVEVGTAVRSLCSSVSDLSTLGTDNEDLLNAIKVVCSIKPSSGHSSDSNDEVLETAIRISTK